MANSAPLNGDSQPLCILRHTDNFDKNLSPTLVKEKFPNSKKYVFTIYVLQVDRLWE
jgi:hypothetical protein